MWLIAIISSIVCGIAFYGLLGLVGIVPGMLIGFLIAGRIEDSRRLRAMEDRLEELARTVDDRLDFHEPGFTPAPEPARSPEPVSEPGPAPVPAPVTEPIHKPAPEPTPEPVQEHAPAPEPAVTPVPVPEPEQKPEPVAAAPKPAPEPVTAAPRPAVPAARPAAPRVSAPPPEPPRTYGRDEPPASFFDDISKFFTGGNLAVTVGMIILFIGMSFLVKYAAERGWFPVELRLSLAGLAGIAMLVIGWRVAVSRRIYGLVLQGGGIGIMYLTTFAALRLYGLIPAWSAFIILVVLCVSSAILAVRQDASELAFMAAVGGFLAPVIASTGSGNHVFLFSYYAIINAGIAAVAWFRAWRKLNVLGFMFTYGIGMSWGYKYYTPAHFNSVEPFVVLYFLLFAFIAVAFANRYEESVKMSPVEGSLVFGTPVVTFFLQSLMVTRFEYGLAISAFVMGAFYVTCATALFTFRPDRMKGIAQAFLAFGTVFTTLAVPLAVDGRWTSAIWALEGAGIYWAGVRQEKPVARGFGLLVQICAGFAFFEGLDHAIYGSVAVLNSFYMGTLILAVSGFATAYFTHFSRGRIQGGERYIGHVMVWWGVIWWLTGGLHEIFEHLGYRTQVGGAVIFLAMSFLLIALAHRRLAWTALRPPAVAVVPLLWIAMFIGLLMGGHPLEGIGYIAWPVAVVSMYLTLYLVDGMNRTALGIFHAFGFWLFGYLVSAEVSYQTDYATSHRADWGMSVWGFVPAVLMLMTVSLKPRLKWPLGSLPWAYGRIIPGGLMFWMVAWFLGANLSEPGNAWPLPYLPLMNPLDLVSGIALFSMLVWNTDRSYEPDLKPIEGAAHMFYWVWGPAVLLWLNAGLIRAIHHFAGIPFNYSAMMSSVLVQASLSVFWSVVSFIAMVYANRRGIRPLWMSGAVMMGVVVLKLFVIDLSGVGSISRIVSFVGVGVLLLIIGYFTPLPPKRKEVV